MSETLGARVSWRKGRDNAFDSIRLFAAASVIVSHSFVLTAGTIDAEPLFSLTGGRSSIGSAAVAAFFIVSGYLISMSFDRAHTWTGFALNRTLRIVPALWVCVLATVLVLGPCVTTCSSLRGYFGGKETIEFISHLIFLGRGYSLSGVFDSHPYSGAVNGSLWTLRYEIGCYVAGTLLLIMGRLRTVCVGLAWLMTVVAGQHFDPGDMKGVSYHLVTFGSLFRFYGGGMLCFLLRNHIVLDRRFVWFAIAAVVVSAQTRFFDATLASAGAIAVISFAYLAPQSVKTSIGGNDISYGLYIYAFPVQQLLVPVSLATPFPWATNMILAMIITSGVASVSWRFIEKPAMKYRVVGTK